MALCNLCPRRCNAMRGPDRGEGYCHMGTLPVVARAAAHLWEEPCISGTRGSGTVFFSGCALGCVFCQNESISHHSLGRAMNARELSELFARVEELGVHNLNLVTPSHFAPVIFEALRLRRPGIPVVWNSSGYETVELVEAAARFVDVFLPDLKYFSAETAQQLAGALEKSCNGYFIRLGQALGADAVRAMAEQLGFGQAIPLTDALHTAAGVLPEREALASSGAYANFCFGQGELLASPLQVAAMMNTIACGGICHTPLLLETTLDETTGTPLTALSHVRSRRVLTKRTAAALQALLAGVVAGGTGHEAALPGQTAAGKTGTAQTGQFSGGTELKNYWFAGFVPAEQPRYTIVVLQDTQAEPAFSSAAIFARVAAGLEILAP